LFTRSRRDGIEQWRDHIDILANQLDDLRHRGITISRPPRYYIASLSQDPHLSTIDNGLVSYASTKGVDVVHLRVVDVGSGELELSGMSINPQTYGHFNGINILLEHLGYLSGSFVLNCNP
jgi:hypothetical protein